MADILYNIATGRLSGKVGDYSFVGFAWSGGRGGSKTVGAVHPTILNNPFLTSLKLKGDGIDNPNYAGPLPMGTYVLRNHESKPNWIRLLPTNPTAMHGRDGFAIHGRGLRGSDGCIVPEDFRIVQELYRCVNEYFKLGRSIQLEVIAVGDLDVFLKRIELQGRIV